MARDLTAAVQSALASDKLALALLYEGEFESGWLRLWTGVGSLTWNSYTWTGAGKLLAFSLIQETTDTAARGFTVSLSGMDGSLISTVVAYARQGKAGSFYIVLFDSSGAVIPDPILAFKGKLDVPSVDDGAATCTISVQYESRLIRLDTPVDLKYTSEDQQIAHPEDNGFDFVPFLQDAVIAWGVPGAPQVTAQAFANAIAGHVI